MRDLTRTNSICPPPETVLLESVKKNDVETVKGLINSNKHLLTYEYPFTSKTILLTACTEADVQPSTIQTLIDLGANLEGNADWKPLHLAVQNPNSSTLEVILKNIDAGQINDTVEGNTALHSLVKGNAIRENEEQFCKNIELLLQAGININQGDGKNLSAIFWAAKNDYQHVVKTILETSICHVDLDSHKLRNKTARILIKEKGLYNGPLPERIMYQIPKDKIFSLIKLAQEDEFIRYFNTLSLTNPSDFINLDDGTSTLLQYCCEKGLTKIAKYLIERGAKVNKIIKNHDKTPLELTAENGYYEILEMLVNQTDLEIPPSVFCYLLKHSDNAKFDKIDHERCCQIIFKKLELNKTLMDVNGEDELKNTPIHYSLRYADEATTEKLLKLGASLACKNNFGIMPIEDIKPELLERHLDECVKFNVKNKNDEKRDFEVVFDYHSLIPPRNYKNSKFHESDPEDVRNNNEVVPETEVIAYMSRAPEFRALLKHPVIVSFLFMKWHRIRLLFYTNLLFYFMFVTSLISYIFTYYAYFDIEKPSDFVVGLSKLSWVTLNLTFWLLVLREIFQMTVSPTNYFKNFENFVEIVLMIITGMILYIDAPTADTRKQLASIAILLAAFELVLMVGQHPKLSTNVVMLKTVSVNFFKLLLWYSLLIIAFALSFYILFAKSSEVSPNVNGTTTDEEEEEDLFTGPGKSVFKTIVMLTGEFDAGSINFHTYPITSKLIFSLFVFMITIILLNLLNGLAVSDTQTIKNEAELVGHIARAQHIYYVESMLLGNILPTTLLKCVQSLFCCFPCDRNTTFTFLTPIARRICIFRASQNCQLIVFPNNHGKICYEFDVASKRPRKSLVSCSRNCSDTYLDKETVKRINAIVKVRRDKIDESAISNIEKLYAEIAALKMKLDDFLNTCIQNKNEFK
ncbi:transient receptor potential cation channel protein painless-like [Zophobas morio]|uniref:transient receptor potential cation channel protein painless-like n=1 Tax=Zophobas morio TaxID=2755281 RepID=UPI003083BCCD